MVNQVERRMVVYINLIINLARHSGMRNLILSYKSCYENHRFPSTFLEIQCKDFDWITDDMSVIRKDFLPGELQSIYKENNVEGCVTVQVNQTEEENEFLFKFCKRI